jgi:hypothetical protein
MLIWRWLACLGIEVTSRASRRSRLAPLARLTQNLDRRGGWRARLRNIEESEDRVGSHGDMQDDVYNVDS